ncbi:hypothetical protein JHK82_052931 [Glycine max]|nr:hypothetical protein JHK82_052931 [Glycine max]
MPRYCSSSMSSFYISGGGGRSMTPSCGHNESVYYGYGNPSLVEFGMDEEVITEPVDSSRARDSISVTIHFRPLSEREYHNGDEIAWYADGDKIVRNEYNPAIAYLMAQILLHRTLHSTIYEVDKLQIGGGNFLTKSLILNAVTVGSGAGNFTTLNEIGITSSCITRVVSSVKQTDGIRPFTMPLMGLACTALERVPLTRSKVIENLMKKFNQDLVFCRAPDDNERLCTWYGID